MCTCLSFTTKDHYFGRNLDLEARFGEQVVITPRNYQINLMNYGRFNLKYAIIGMATMIDGYPMYADSANEYGLSMAGLYFPGNAVLNDVMTDKLNLAAYELPLYFLGKYKNLDEMEEEIKNLNITHQTFKPGLPSASMHFMMSDKKRSIVIEQTIDGLKVYDNPVGVLTNNPPFPFHLMNLNNYLNCSPEYAYNKFSSKLDLESYGVGMGALGLPGDTSPASRFVRAAFNKLNAKCDNDEVSSVSEFFHLLDSVSMVRGSTITKEGKLDLTTYSCCINQDQGIYYYKTYDNNQLNAVKLNDYNMNSETLSIFDLQEEQNINYQN